MQNINRKYAWLPDVPDQRDYRFGKLASVQSFQLLTLPSSTTLRRWCSEVENQQYLGSCTAQAIIGAEEYNECKSGNGGKLFKNLSRLFVYYNERVIENSVDQDAGAMIRDGIKTLASQGVCTENEWPHDLRKWKTKPSPTCYANALQRKISSYYRLNNTNLVELKSTLANGHPFIFGFAVYESFVSNFVYRTGIVPMPTTRESLLGGHAVLAIGYDDSTQRFIVKNSWGKSWGLKDSHMGGYFTIPYDYLTNTDLADDFWVIIK